MYANDFLVTYIIILHNVFLYTKGISLSFTKLYGFLATYIIILHNFYLCPKEICMLSDDTFPSLCRRNSCTGKVWCPSYWPSGTCHWSIKGWKSMSSFFHRNGRTTGLAIQVLHDNIKYKATILGSWNVVPFFLLWKQLPKNVILWMIFPKPDIELAYRCLF